MPEYLFAKKLEEQFRQNIRIEMAPSSNQKDQKLALGKMGPLMSGAFAGLAVDLTLFPIDTLKTRLQSSQGLAAAGGFKSIYAGMPSVLVGSAPGSALFFTVYEVIKGALGGKSGGKAYSLSSTSAHMVAASMGEIAACLIRVPTELVKQRAQSFPSAKTRYVLRLILEKDGFIGLYRGYGATICREIPFSLIEFPLWEYLKIRWATSKQRAIRPWEGAACGSVAGAIAAGLTTPLDVAKTRIMLSQKLHAESPSMREVLNDIWKAKGLKGLYVGFWPRTIWMALGGFVFFGAYETMSDMLTYWARSNETPSNLSVMPIGSFIYVVINRAFFEPLLAKQQFKNFDEVVDDAKALGERRKAFIEQSEKKKREKH